MRFVLSVRTLAEETRASRMMLAWLLPAAILLIANWCLYLWKLFPLAGTPDPVAIHYSVLVGIDKLLPWYWTLLPAVAGSVHWEYQCVTLPSGVRRCSWVQVES